VVLSGSRAAPRAIARHVVQLSDPDTAETRQPYHHGFYTTEDDPREIARRVAIVKRCAKRSVGAFIREVRNAQRISARSAKALAERSGAERSDEPLRSALVVGSVIDPAMVGNPHIRAHAHEGRLFRTVLEDALRAHGIESDIIVDKQLSARATKDLGRPPSGIARTMAAFGKVLGGPWRADEKAAATAAWLSLAR